MGLNGAPALTLAVLFGVFFVLLSLISLWNYFFAGDPIRRNLEAQIEAKRDAPNLLRDYGRYKRRQFYGAVLVLFAISVTAVAFAPDLSAAVAEAALELSEAVVRGVWASAQAFWREFAA